MQDGIIFNIERCSLSDGPGVRTVVFFKGCSLACLWCHNPESISPAPQLFHYAHKCIGCGRCAAVCPGGALKAKGDFTPGREFCLACGRCAEACPTGAKQLSGRRMNAGQVLESLLRDKPFYDASGGGVTFSGGECMLQSGFLQALLEACCDQKLHTAVDTAGNVPFESFRQIDPYTDMYLYDIKCLTPPLHKSLTGVNNGRILDNYKQLWTMSPEKLLVRIPVIPGINTADGELERIARFLHDYPPAGYELLPYHALGNAKRAALGLPSFEAPLPDGNAMKTYRENFDRAYHDTDIHA